MSDGGVGRSALVAGRVAERLGGGGRVTSGAGEVEEDPDRHSPGTNGKGRTRVAAVVSLAS